jgi:hypothetical protein
LDFVAPAFDFERECGAATEERKAEPADFSGWVSPIRLDRLGSLTSQNRALKNLQTVPHNVRDLSISNVTTKSFLLRRKFFNASRLSTHTAKSLSNQESDRANDNYRIVWIWIFESRVTLRREGVGHCPHR